MDDKTSWTADEAVVQSAAQTEGCWIDAVVEKDNRGECSVHQSIHWIQESIGVEHLFFAAMQIKSLYFEEDGESTFTVVREEAEEKIVYGRMVLVLAGTTADHPEERPPPEPDPVLS